MTTTITLNDVQLEIDYYFTEQDINPDLENMRIESICTVSGDDITELVLDKYHDEICSKVYENIN